MENHLWECVCRGRGWGEEGEEEKEKIILENFREQSGRKLSFFSHFSEVTFSKTENSLDQGDTFDDFFFYLNSFFHWICFQERSLIQQQTGSFIAFLLFKWTHFLFGM